MTEPTPYLRTRKAALATLTELRLAAASGQLDLLPVEMDWLDKLSAQADTLPEDEDEFISGIIPEIDSTQVRLEEYGISE